METALLWVGKLRFGHTCGGSRGLLRCDDEGEVIRCEQLLKVWIAEVLEKGSGRGFISPGPVGCMHYPQGLAYCGCVCMVGKARGEGPAIGTKAQREGMCSPLSFEFLGD